MEDMKIEVHINRLVLDGLLVKNHEGSTIQKAIEGELTGGSIHNIALNAAFLAAHSSLLVTMPLVLEGAHTEFRKLERPVNEAEFRWRVPQGAGV